MALRHKLGAVTATIATAALVATGMVTTASAEEGPIDAGITVPKVEGMGADWINGVDISSVLSLEESGVVFRDDNGDEADLFDVLADHDVNWVRVRVWNDPWTAGGEGYGGGNVDADRATTIAKRATDAGMRVLVNFHYSDFWAHPGQQQRPKAWKHLDTVEQRATAVYEYTKATLQQMEDAGVDIGMVQIGNENTPNSSEQIVEVGGWDNFATVVSAGSAAVREVSPQAQVAVHFTNPERGNHPSFAAALEARDVDYDVFLTSYYPFWHGTLDNLTAQLNTIAQTYDKDVAVAEVSWAYTLEDGDGHENTIRTPYDQYSISVQGQALAIRDVMQAVADVDNGRGLGTFYWEPAWLPVGPADDPEGNALLWEEFGSGWASSYAGEYDPDDAGVWYGGSAWDNQALFDFDGYPLESLNVYQYAKTGSIAPREVDEVGSPAITVRDGEPVSLPAAVTVKFTDGTSEDQPVTWELNSAWIVGAGIYTVTGTTSSGLSVTGTVEVLDPAATGENLVINPSFEDGATGWEGEGSGFTIGRDEDPRTGDLSLHWYSSNANSFRVSQTLTGVPAGTYRLSAFLQGGGAGPDDSVQIFAQHGIHTVSASATLQGYEVWQNPTTDLLTVGAGGTVDLWLEWDMSAGAWGTLDDVSFALSGDLPDADTATLADLQSQAQGIDREGYSDPSLQTLDRALARAALLLGSPAPSQEAVDAAVQALADAIDGLAAGDDTIPDPTVEPVVLTVPLGGDVTLPETVTVVEFDDSSTQETVVWNDVLDLLESPGTYSVSGVTQKGWPVSATVVIDDNAIVNGGFEKGVDDVAPWDISAGDEWPAEDVGTAWVVEYGDIEGEYALNGWSHVTSGPEFWISAEQSTGTLPAGTYALSATAAGGNEITGAGSDTTYELGVWDGSQSHTTSLELLGWPEHHTGSVEFTLSEPASVNVWLSADLVPGDWSYVDDVQLVRVDAAPAVDTTDLEAAIATALAVDRAVFTEDSLAALDARVERGQIVMAASRATQEQVDAETAAIVAAIDALVEVDDSDDEGPGDGEGPGGGDEPGDGEGPGDGDDADEVQMTVSDLTVRPGDAVTITVTNVVGDTVEFGIQSEYQQLATVPVVDGTASATVTIPTTLDPGTHHLLALDEEGTVLAQIEIEVLAAAEAGSDEVPGAGADAGDGQLPRTGANVLAPTLVAALLLASGLILAVRSRRQEA